MYGSFFFGAYGVKFLKGESALCADAFLVAALRVAGDFLVFAVVFADDFVVFFAAAFFFGAAVFFAGIS